jgi:uncharacterized protein (TIGR02266 family)
MSDHARQDKRYPSKHELIVQCSSWAEFAQLYATDVSKGGMFIATDAQLPILSEIALSLRLPEGHEVALRARVVHVMDTESAARDGKIAGVGVQFIELDAMRKQQIQQLVDFARAEGASANPTSTYASRLFETAASLPPSRVLDALPPDSVASKAIGGEVAAPPSRSPARANSGPLNSARPDATESRRPRRASSSSVGRAGDDIAPAQGGSKATQPPKPSDPAKLKLGMTHLAHKHFEQAIKTFELMVAENPGDRQAQQWVHIANARLRLKRNDEDGAAEHYQKALDVGEDNHEARKFVREHSSKKRLNSLPFGRYFTKKP